jgi:glyoxylate utilization-related uncharacterized protein
METIYEAKSAEPVEHFHPSQVERFEVLEGVVRVRIAGAERDLKQGEILVIEPGTPHAMWNAGSDRARMNWQTRPALRTELFFEAVWGLAREDNLGPEQGAALMREYADVFRLAPPPDPA